MGIETILGAGASIIGGAMQGDAAEDAAGMQAGATREATALQREQFNQLRDDLTPYRNLGAGSSNKLAELLGLAPVYSGQRRTMADIRAELAKQNPFQATGGANGYYAPSAMPQASGEALEALTYGRQFGPQAPGPSFEQYNSSLDQQAKQQYDAQEAEYQKWAAANGTPSADSGYLLRNFTGADLENEPGYQFGRQEGLNALDRRMASGGNYFSGAALKGAMRFGNDYASTKYGDAFNRDSANKTRIYNFLQGGTSIGQNAAAQTGNAGMNMANQVGALTTANANAQGAARIAGANALSGGINGAFDNYQQNQLMNRVLGRDTMPGWGSGGGWTGGGRTVPTYPGAEY